MIIDNLDALKTWLVKKLEPICDADPSALAKYVIALAKKDKPEADLKALCEDQLDVFLGDETRSFVTELFETLSCKSYFPPQPSKNTDSSNMTLAAVEAEQKGKKRKSFEENEQAEDDKIQKTENKVDVGKIKAIENDKETSRDKNVARSADNNEKEKRRNSTESSVSMADADKKLSVEKDKPVKISSHLTLKDELELKNELDDHNLRSVSQDRSMKSVSPAVRTRHGHSSRRRSPRSPSRSGRHTRTSRRERTRRDHHDKSRERRPRRREKEKCRDYEEKGFCMLGEVCPYDHGHDPVEVDDRNLPQMLSLAGIPSTQANTQHLPTPPMQIIPNVIPARPMLPQISTALTLHTGLTTVQVQKPRPIPSPAEMPGNQVPIFRPRNPMVFMRNNISPPPVAPGSQQVIRPIAVNNMTPKPATPSNGEPYNPEEPSIEVEESDTVRKDVSDSPSQTSTTTTTTDGTESQGEAADNSTEPRAESMNVDEQDKRTPDELVQIAMGNVPLTPIVGSQPNNIFQLNGAMMQQQPHQSQPMFTNNMFQQTYLPMTMTPQQQYQHQLQLQQQQQQQQHQQAAIMAVQQIQKQNVVQVPSRPPYRHDKVLEIRKIPKELNNMVKLSEHFQKFGTITKLQSPFDHDLQGALIEFSSNREAHAAYSAPEAILGNRFIKMFWHHPNKPQRNNNQGNANAGIAGVGNPSSIESKQKESPARPEQKPKKIASTEELRYRNPKSDPKLLQMEKKKELEKLKIELMKKKQTHYEELVKKQKDILAKLEAGIRGLPKEDRSKLVKAFKACDAAVQKLKNELLEDAKPKPQTSASPAKQFKDTKKEILDKEIDIYHGNLEGEELIEAKKALEALKREAAYSSGRGRGYRGRGRGSWYRGRGRGRGGFQANSIDNRPKQILVTGYDASKKDDVVAHFATFGHLDSIEETSNDKMILSFPTRKAAELAAVQGSEFNGKQLVLAWFTGQSKTSVPSADQKIQRRMTRSLSQSLSEKDLDDELLELDKEEEEMLLADVEDDDDDDDDAGSDERSWRR